MFKNIYCRTLILIERKEREKVHTLITPAIIAVLLFPALHFNLFPFADNILHTKHRIDIVNAFFLTDEYIISIFYAFYTIFKQNMWKIL